MKLVCIYGPPGVGKLTVAGHLARAHGLKLFDNHVSIDCARTVFEFGTKPFGRLVGTIRLATFGEAAREGVSLVFTFVYAHPQDAGFIERAHEAVEAHGGRVCLVRLVCDIDELERRLPAAERARRGKMASLDLLREVSARYDLFSPVAGRESLSIDNTALPPAEVARRIAEHYGLEESSQ